MLRGVLQQQKYIDLCCESTDAWVDADEVVFATMVELISWGYCINNLLSVW